MANRIDAGSLVCMGRRNVKGQGIVLDRVRDVNYHAEFDVCDAWQRMYNRKHPDYLFKQEENYSTLWSLRQDMTKAIREEIAKSNPKANDDLIKHFFSYNTAFSYQKFGKKITKLKTDFSLVRWYKPPSEYSENASNWYKGKEVWHPTKLIKNL
jgi:hypothetical protein